MTYSTHFKTVSVFSRHMIWATNATRPKNKGEAIRITSVFEKVDGIGITCEKKRYNVETLKSGKNPNIIAKNSFIIYLLFKKIKCTYNKKQINKIK